MGIFFVAADSESATNGKEMKEIETLTKRTTRINFYLRLSSPVCGGVDDGQKLLIEFLLLFSLQCRAESISPQIAAEAHLLKTVARKASPGRTRGEEYG